MGEGLYLMMAEKQQEAGGGGDSTLTGYVHSGSVDYLPDCCDKIPQSGSLHRKWEQFINPQDPPTTSIEALPLGGSTTCSNSTAGSEHRSQTPVPMADPSHSNHSSDLLPPSVFHLSRFLEDPEAAAAVEGGVCSIRACEEHFNFK